LRSFVFGLFFGLAVLASAVVLRPVFLLDIPTVPSPHTRFWEVQELPFHMVLSTRGADFLKDVESFSPTAYPDAGGGYSIGYGFQRWKGRRVTRAYPGRVTAAQSNVEFQRQLGLYEGIVRASLVENVTQPMFDALVSVCYNTGRVTASLRRKLRDSEMITVRDFTASATVRGKFHAGVYYRRLREYLVFAGRYDEAMTTRYTSVAHARAAYQEFLSVPAY